MGKARRRKAGARSPEGRPALPKRKAAAPSDALDFQNAKVGTADANAVILCEGALATPTGKTGNGLLRRSRRSKGRGVIGSKPAGQDAGEGLDGGPTGL